MAAVARAHGAAVRPAGELQESWPFCPLCGTILDAAEGRTIVCELCGCAFENLEGMKSTEVVTHSAVRPPPAWLTARDEDEDDDDEDEEDGDAGHGVRGQQQRRQRQPRDGGGQTQEGNDGQRETRRKRKKGKIHATVEEACPECGHPEMYFYTMQLRSADEGSTVFYECPECSHTYSVNN